MTLTKLEQWEKKLHKILDEVDDLLEDQFGNKYRLHPVRMERGETSNKSMDGLFNVTANFSLGLGSELGRGYVLKIKIVSLEKISEEIQNMVEEISMQKISEKLPVEFPGRELSIQKDNNLIKIYGDLSLDKV